MTAPASLNPPQGFRTYVEYALASKALPFGGARVEEAASRDPAALTFPKTARSFYFFDAPADNIEDQRDASRRYLIAERMLTHAEAVALDPKERHTAGKSKILQPGRQLTDYDIAAAVWDVKHKPNGVFALLAAGGVADVDDKDIVVDAAGRQLHPQPKPLAPEPQVFTPALRQPVQAMKPPRFKPKF